MLFAAEVAVAHKSIATLDLVIIGIYFAIVFGIGLYFSKRERTSEDYFLAGRDIGWFFIGASLFVSNISTEHFIGLSGTGASSGMAVGHFEWLACLILLVLGWVFVPFYLRSNVFTMPEFLERRFNRNCAVYLAAISIIAYIFTKISVQLYAASVVLERVAGWSLWKTAVVLVIAVGIYTIAGGLSAVIYTDTVQTLILITGAVALTVIGLHRVGGFEHLRTMVPASYFHMIKPASDSQFPWTGIFFGAPILGIWYWCTDQVIVQRVLSARDEGHAKLGTIFAGFLKILPVFILVLPGIIAFALFPEQVKKPDYAYPTLILNLLPTGLVGLVMAALLAAVMGAMSSVFNSTSTLVTLDFYKKIRPQASERQLVNFGRIATGMMVLLGLLWVPFIHYISSQLYIYLAKRPGLYQPANLGLFRSRNPVAAPERLRSYHVAADRLRPGGHAIRLGACRSSRRCAFPIARYSLACGHELLALCDFHVRRLLGRPCPCQPDDQSSGPQTASRIDLCHCRRQNRNHRGGSAPAQALARNAHRTRHQHRLQSLVARHGDRLVDLLPLARLLRTGNK